MIDDIYFESFGQFTRDIDMAREKRLKVDSEEIKVAPHIFNIHTTQKVPNGRWDINYNNIDFECFFHYKQSPILFVFLSGAITAKNVSVPYFARWSWYKFVNGSMLNIADPMYRLYEKLQLGWYYGNDEINIQQVLAELVLEVAKKIGVEQSNIVFVGSSGGGYASIACSSYIEKAKSIAINPQMVLKDWPYSKNFSEITKIDLIGEDKWHRNNILYHYQHKKSNVYILFINLRSKFDMRQVERICETMNISVRYGLNVWKNMILWLYDADLTPWIDYHDIQGNRCIWHTLEQIALYSSDMEKVKACSHFITLLNEFYYEQNKEIKYWRGRLPNLNWLQSSKDENRKTAIWGIGEYAEYLNGDLFDIEKANHYNIEGVIDNDMEKRGNYCGLKIWHPSEIENWKQWFIIITSKKYTIQIQEQLEGMGLVYQKDFITYQDLFQHHL